MWHIETDETGASYVRPGRKDCTRCWGRGDVATTIPCPTCNGTGNGPRGGRRGCKSCHGFRTAYDQVNRTVCDRCGGNPKDAEEGDLFDRLPKDLWRSLDFQVYRADRRQTWNERNLGAGCIVSVTDYGRAWDADDPQALIEDVRDRESAPQAVSVAERETGRLCDHVAIVVHRGGYTVVPVWDDGTAGTGSERGLPPTYTSAVLNQPV